MNKNIKTYTLLGIVALIWGVVGYRLFSSFGPEVQLNEPEIDKGFTLEQMKPKDTFSIKADYRDPFLGTMAVKKKKTKKRAIRTSPKVQFPSIVYTGLIADQQNKQHIFFVTINNTQYLMQSKSEEDGVTLLSGTKDGIKVKFKGIIKQIPLKDEAS
ncbi:hypothetical protein [Flagellimonas sp.]|uniref:hypothetical protein n=1 Tax=Flagellimonas sp. TaxID=2058762 RepID=UPI003F4A288E